MNGFPLPILGPLNTRLTINSDPGHIQLRAPWPPVQDDGLNPFFTHFPLHGCWRSPEKRCTQRSHRVEKSKGTRFRGGSSPWCCRASATRHTVCIINTFFRVHYYNSSLQAKSGRAGTPGGEGFGKNYNGPNCCACCASTRGLTRLLHLHHLPSPSQGHQEWGWWHRSCRHAGKQNNNNTKSWAKFVSNNILYFRFFRFCFFSLDFFSMSGFHFMQI